MLDNDELFAVASNTPKPLPMPELSTIWDDPQELSIDPFEVVMTADNKEANLPATDILTTAIASQTYDGGCHSFMINTWSCCTFHLDNVALRLSVFDGSS